MPHRLRSATRALAVGTLAIAASAGLLAVGPAAPASASCAQDAGPAGSPVVFVGIADEQRGGHTRFVVQEVWTGPPLAVEVWVLSGQEQPPFPLSLFSAVSSSVDAEFVEGQTYLVGATDDFATNACTSREYDATADAEQAPPDVDGPVDGGSTGARPPLDPVLQGGVAAALVAAVLALPWLLRRRRRRARGRPTA